MGLSLCKGDWFENIFRGFDKDGSGFLDSKELSGLLTEAFKYIGVKHEVSSMEAKMAMKAMDKDKDGKLSQQETYQIFEYFKSNFTSITGKQK